MKLAFVILQYMASNETVECVESIRAHIGTVDYKIIIVDNASPDDSYEKIEKLYESDEDIVLIKSDTNLGFAKGNNLGYRYAVKNYAPEYIIMLNNDVVIFQNGIYERISECYEKYEFAVMGPMILTKDGKYTSSPMPSELRGKPNDEPATKDEFLKAIKEFKFKLNLMKIGLYRPIRYLYQKFLKKEEGGGLLYFEDHINYKLHGSFLIFSKKYQEAFPVGLDERTFMYDEEFFLQYHVVRAGMKLLYTPRYCVYHKEDASTSKVVKNNVKKAQFQLSGMIRSRKMYIQMLEDGEE